MPATSDFAAKRAKKFPQEYCLAAQHAQRANGVYASIALAQAALETGFFKTPIPGGSNNCLGIKATAGKPYVESRTQEQLKNGQMITITAKFRKFASYDECFAHYGRLLTSPTGPYRSALPYLHDKHKWFQRVAKIYATDLKYFEKVMSIVEQWRLHEFDLAPEALAQPVDPA